MGRPFFREKGRTWAVFQKIGNLFSCKDILSNIHTGLDTAIAVVFNILWLIQSGHAAIYIFLTGSIDI